METLRRHYTRFLVDDEDVSLASKSGDVCVFRLRVWRGSDATPVALVSQHGEASTEPSFMTVKLANYVNEAVLRHTEFGVLYFEDEFQPYDSTWNLTQCHFHFYGNAHRLKMYRPERQAISWPKFENSMDAGPVERRRG